MFLYTPHNISMLQTYVIEFLSTRQFFFLTKPGFPVFAFWFCGFFFGCQLNLFFFVSWGNAYDQQSQMIAKLREKSDPGLWVCACVQPAGLTLAASLPVPNFNLGRPLSLTHLPKREWVTIAPWTALVTLWWAREGKFVKPLSRSNWFVLYFFPSQAHTYAHPQKYISLHPYVRMYVDINVLCLHVRQSSIVFMFACSTNIHIHVDLCLDIGIHAHTNLSQIIRVSLSPHKKGKVCPFPPWPAEGFFTRTLWYLLRDLFFQAAFVRG